MIVYYTILLFGIFFYSEKSKYYIQIFSVAILILGIFRGIDVGTDYQSYINSFSIQNYSEYNFNFFDIKEYLIRESIGGKQLEPLWSLLNYFILTIDGSYFSVNLIVLVSVVSLYSYTFKRQSKNPVLSFLLLYALFFYFGTFNIVRQSIAISFIFCSYYFFENKKYLSGVTSLTIASLFHFTAIFGIFPILLFIIPSFKIKTNSAIFLLSMSLLFGTNISGFILSLVEIDTIYTTYTENKITGTKNLIISYLNYFLQFLLFFVVVRTRKKSVIDDKFTQIWLIGLILQNIFLEITFFSRLCDYFLVAQLIAIPYYLPSQNYTSIINANKKFITVIIIIIIFFSFNIYFNKQGVVPFSIY